METDASIKENQSSRRQRSARRLKHEAKAQLFKNQAGGLEDIRQKLGMRPAQISDLLKVHPSAWIRWNRTGRVPPHVFQMLEWYLELHDLRTRFTGWNGAGAGTPFSARASE